MAAITTHGPHTSQTRVGPANYLEWPPIRHFTGSISPLYGDEMKLGRTGTKCDWYGPMDFQSMVTTPEIDINKIDDSFLFVRRLLKAYFEGQNPDAGLQGIALPQTTSANAELQSAIETVSKTIFTGSSVNAFAEVGGDEGQLPSRLVPWLGGTSIGNWYNEHYPTPEGQLRAILTVDGNNIPISIPQATIN